MIDWLLYFIIPCTVIAWCIREIGREWLRIKARMVAPGSSFVQQLSQARMDAWKRKNKSNVVRLPRLPRTPLDDSGYKGE